MKKRLCLVFFALVMALGATFPAAADVPETPEVALVKNFYAQLVDTMKQGDQLGFQGRMKKLDPAVRKAFNLPLMARTAVGFSWSKAQPDEQQKLIDAFSIFSVANYASQFKRFDGERFDVTGEKPASQGGAIVETTLTPKDGDPVVLNYLVRPDESGAPRIVDVFLDASISQLAMRRSEFTAVIKREGLPALVSSLEDKTIKMEMN
jgi:phospholipid transport system substrate-binding protein